MGTSSIITFSEGKTDNKAIIEPKKNPNVNSQLGEIHLKPAWHGWQRDREWLWFPLKMTAEVFCSNIMEKQEFVKMYPRIIQWTDGKYYVYVGTHSSDERYNIKGDNMVYYKEILISEGEKMEYVGMNFDHFKLK
jgi:hypothetical protein